MTSPHPVIMEKRAREICELCVQELRKQGVTINSSNLAKLIKKSKRNTRSALDQYGHEYGITSIPNKFKNSVLWMVEGCKVVYYKPHQDFHKSKECFVEKERRERRKREREEKARLERAQYPDVEPNVWKTAEEREKRNEDERTRRKQEAMKRAKENAAYFKRVSKNKGKAVPIQNPIESYPLAYLSYMGNEEDLPYDQQVALRRERNLKQFRQQQAMEKRYGRL